MRLIRFFFICLATLASASASDNHNKRADSCASGYTLCAPAGATTTSTPDIGDSEFLNLFVDIVESSLPASKRSISPRGAASLCCISSLNCLAMNTMGLPFCYDKFTTDYFLPDGSFGTVVGGAYTSATGDTANLETGDFTLTDGTTGNIYSADQAEKPNTATLPMPSQFTSAGVGTAIPASDLGVKVTLTFTTTFPATTVPATTVPESTITSAESVVFVSATVTNTVSSGSSDTVLTTESPTPVSTVETTIVVPPTTISATTKQASTSVFTTVVIENSAAASPTKSAGNMLKVPSMGWSVFGACGLVGLVFL